MRATFFLSILLLLLSSAVLAQSAAASPPAYEQAADEVLAAVAAKDADALGALAGKADPDPWLVADELLGRGEADAAVAFAAAAKGKDVENLPAYVERHRDAGAETASREALARANAAALKKDAGAALKAASAAPAAPDTVTGVRLCTVLGIALRMSGRGEESHAKLLETVEFAERLGWFRRASRALYEAASGAGARGDWRTSLGCAQRRLAVDELRGSKRAMAASYAGVAYARYKLKEYAEALSSYRESLVLHRELDDRAGVAGRTFSIGACHWMLGDREKGLEFYERALAAWRELDDRKSMAAGLGRIATCQKALGELEKAVAAWKEELALREELKDARRTAAVLQSLGHLHEQLGRHDEALACYERSVPLKEADEDKSGAAWALERIGRLNWEGEAWSKALRAAERALALREELNDKPGIARMLTDIGWCWFHRENFPRMLSHLERAVRLYQELEDRAREGRALSYVAMAHQYLSDFAEALACYERALAISQAAKDRAGVKWTISQLGLIHSVLGNYATALSFYERELRLIEESGDREEFALATLRVSTAHRRLGDFQAARSMLDRYLELAEEFDEIGHRANAHGAYAALFRETGEHEKALKHYEQAVELFVRSGVPRAAGMELTRLAELHLELGQFEEARSAAERSVAMFREQGDRWSEGYGLLVLGKVHAARGSAEEARRCVERTVRLARRLRTPHLVLIGLSELSRIELDARRPERALAAARQGLAELEVMLGGLAEAEGTESREKYGQLFALGTLAAVRLKDPATAVEFLENGRAGALLETLGRGRAVRFADLPEELVAAELKARTEESSARRVHLGALDGGIRQEIKVAAEALDAAMERRRDLVSRLQRESKRAAGVFYPRAALLDEMQALLSDDTALVLYGICLEEVLAVVVTREAARIVVLGNTPEIEAACGDVARTIEGVDTDGLSREGREAADLEEAAVDLRVLGKLLVEPLGLEEKVELVLVSPAGAIGYVPWGALFDRPVACVPSGTTWVLLEDEARRPGSKILALGDPNYTARPGDRSVEIYRGGALRPLPASGLEARAIGDTLLLGERATEKGLADALGSERRWRAVHLACHGLVDTERPLLSSLALTPGDGDDGFLTCLDVFSLEVPADLVVLSACETARGKVLKTEGIVGLTRAFMYAGSPRILCSLWKVDDEATQALMVKFYEQWNPKEGEGLPAATALMQAQEFVRNHKKWKHPYYWAAWVLWGLPE